MNYEVLYFIPYRASWRGDRSTFVQVKPHESLHWISAGDDLPFLPMNSDARALWPSIPIMGRGYRWGGQPYVGEPAPAPGGTIKASPVLHGSIPHLLHVGVMKMLTGKSIAGSSTLRIVEDSNCCPYGLSEVAAI
jgi:hypothetical protein